MLSFKPTFSLYSSLLFITKEALVITLLLVVTKEALLKLHYFLPSDLFFLSVFSHLFYSCIIKAYNIYYYIILIILHVLKFSWYYIYIYVLLTTGPSAPAS